MKDISTQWGWVKMADILCSRPCSFFQELIFVMSSYWILFQTNETALVNVMTWHITGSKTLRVRHYFDLHLNKRLNKQPTCWLLNALRRRQVTVMASRITGQSNVCSTVCSDCQQWNWITIVKWLGSLSKYIDSYLIYGWVRIKLTESLHTKMWQDICDI